MLKIGVVSRIKLPDAKKSHSDLFFNKNTVGAKEGKILDPDFTARCKWE